MISHKTVADPLEKTIRQVSELNQQNPDIGDAVKLLREAKDLSDQDFAEAYRKSQAGGSAPNS